MNRASLNKQLLHTTKESNYLRLIDSLKKKAIDKIDDVINRFIYLEVEKERDEDYIPEEIHTIEYKFLDLNIWVDIKVRNEEVLISAVEILDDEDRIYNVLSNLILTDLDNYYRKGGALSSSNYHQSIEIAHDKKDVFNLSPKMPQIHLELKNKYINDIVSICEEGTKLTKIITFLEHGYTNEPMIIKKGITTENIVEILIPIIDHDILPDNQINKNSKKKDKARIIYSSFEPFKLKSYINSISDYYNVNK